MRNLSPLTGLPGNIRIQEEIERMVREESPFAVLYADLDNFKAYNDQKGFVQGDRLIQATARILQDAVAGRAGAEGFVGHVGGDDFVAVVPPDVAEGVARLVVETFDGQIRSSTTPGRGTRVRRVECKESCNGCRSPASRSASRPRRCARSRTTAGGRWPPRESSTPSASRILLRGRPPKVD
jgi:diguanylate cyclase (GGDEF)-like protein